MIIDSVYGTPAGMTPRLFGGDYALMGNQQIERFAKLIILECANIALREEHDPYECIKKHFGID